MSIVPESSWIKKERVTTIRKRLKRLRMLGADTVP